MHEIFVGNVLRDALVGGAVKPFGDQPLEPLAGLAEGRRAAMRRRLYDRFDPRHAIQLHALARAPLVRDAEFFQSAQHDVVAAVRETVGMRDEAGAAHRIDRRRTLVIALPSRTQHHHADQPFAVERIGDHRAVSRLENMQREQRGGEQHHVRERKERNLGRKHVNSQSLVTRRQSLVSSPSRRRSTRD